MTMIRCCWLAAILVLALAACGRDDPTVTEQGTGTSTDGDGGLDAGSACPDGEPAYTEDVEGCVPADGDYRPRDDASADDGWAACISDDGLYHQVEESVSSIARVGAYEEIAALLWSGGRPAAADFTAARLIYLTEEGLDSRVARRFDPHYPAPAEGGCEDEGVPASNPDYCVGPATLQPILNAAFAEGGAGEEPLANAARIAAALQWFLYVSVVKEATTCADAPKDCDSAWAYYGGGEPRESPLGLGGALVPLVPATHDSAYDGLLAVRCWRDLDPAVPATTDELQTRAIAQLDRALLRGLAVLTRQRLAALSCSTGEHRGAALAWLAVVVPLLDRATRERDPAVADLLAAVIAGEAGPLAVTEAIAALDATYPCP